MPGSLCRVARRALVEGTIALGQVRSTVEETATGLARSPGSRQAHRKIFANFTFHQHTLIVRIPWAAPLNRVVGGLHAAPSNSICPGHIRLAKPLPCWRAASDALRFGEPAAPAPRNETLADDVSTVAAPGGLQSHERWHPLSTVPSSGTQWRQRC